MNLLRRSVVSRDIYGLNQPGRSTSLDKFYVGFVKNTFDFQYMGRLQVWIPELGGDPTNPDNWFTMQYVSPMAGATSWLNTSQDPSNSDYTKTQRSYGMWFVPPDNENEVLCAFVNGDPARGVYFGGFFQQYMNEMVPGLPGSNSGNGLPVAEYNKKNTNQITDPNSPSIQRPLFAPLSTAITTQGLENDTIRGISTSGARRQNPSNSVYGI